MYRSLSKSWWQVSQSAYRSLGWVVLHQSAWWGSPETFSSLVPGCTCDKSPWHQCADCGECVSKPTQRAILQAFYCVGGSSACGKHWRSAQPQHFQQARCSICARVVRHWGIGLHLPAASTPEGWQDICHWVFFPSEQPTPSTWQAMRITLASLPPRTSAW